MSRVSCWFVVMLATALLGAGLAWAASGWQIEPTARQHVSFSAISCPSATRCWAVGGTSSIVRPVPRQRPVMELWNGHRWTVVSVRSVPGLRFVSFTDVSCPSARFCMAVGAASRARYGPDSPFAESWDGRTWTSRRMVSQGKRDVGGATSVSCTSSAACVAVGGYSGRPFAQRWDGHDWRTIRAPLVEEGILSPGADILSCMSGTACMAGPVTPIGAGAQLWNGRRWIRQVIPAPSGIVPHGRTVAGLIALACPAMRKCVGFAFVQTGNTSSAELGVTWNGRKWTSAAISGLGEFAYLGGISCLSTRACVAVGGNAVDPIAAFWNGRTWAVQTLPKPAEDQSANLGGVSCNTATSCMAIGSSGNNFGPAFRVNALAERYQR